MGKTEIKENTSTYSIDNSAIPESVKLLTLCGIKMVHIFMCTYVCIFPTAWGETIIIKHRLGRLENSKIRN